MENYVQKARFNYQFAAYRVLRIGAPWKSPANVVNYLGE